MQLLIKQRVFSWSDTYDIYDEYGNPKYYVEAEIFSWGHKLHVYNQEGIELGVIKEKVFSFLPQFQIEINGEVVGTISRNFTFFKNNYQVDYRGWHVEGDFFGWNYEIYEGDEMVLGITKKVLTWGDTYVLDILREEDEIHGLLLVIAIDAANCKSSNNN